MAGTALGVFWEAAILRASCCCCCSLRALAELVSAREEKGGREGSLSTPTLQAEWEEFLARSYQSWETGRKKAPGCEKAKGGWFFPPLHHLGPLACPISHIALWLPAVSWGLYINPIPPQEAVRVCALVL